MHLIYGVYERVDVKLDLLPRQQPGGRDFQQLGVGICIGVGGRALDKHMCRVACGGQDVQRCRLPFFTSKVTVSMSDAKDIVPAEVSKMSGSVSGDTCHNIPSRFEPLSRIPTISCVVRSTGVEFCRLLRPGVSAAMTAKEASPSPMMSVSVRLFICPFVLCRCPYI